MPRVQRSFIAAIKGEWAKVEARGDSNKGSKGNVME
jgi:hypothetical protein